MAKNLFRIAYFDHACEPIVIAGRNNNQIDLGTFRNSQNLRAGVTDKEIRLGIEMPFANDVLQAAENEFRSIFTSLYCFRVQRTKHTGVRTSRPNMNER